MKLSVQRIYESTVVVSAIIREARPMSQRGKFRLARLHTKLMPEFTTIEVQRDDLIKVHGLPVVDEATGEIDKTKWQVPPENMADFVAAWKLIADEEIEIDVQPISVADLDCGSGNGGIEANEILTLGELIAE